MIGVGAAEVHNRFQQRVLHQVFLTLLIPSPQQVISRTSKVHRLPVVLQVRNVSFRFSNVSVIQRFAWAA